MTDLIEIGEQVRAARRASGLSQAALATRSGVSRSRIDALENGRILEIGFRHLSRILSALGLTLNLNEERSRRPTLEDLEEETVDAPRLGRS